MSRPTHNQTRFMLGLLLVAMAFISPLYKYEFDIVSTIDCTNDEPAHQLKPLTENGPVVLSVGRTNNHTDGYKNAVQEQMDIFPVSNSTKPKPFVVCTYLRGNKEKYLIGTIVLFESVRAGMANNNMTSNTINIRTAVVCHESVKNGTRSLLRKMGHDVVMVKDADIDAKSMPSNHFKLLIQKYAVFDLVQYEKALFVDSDAFLLRPENLGTLFGMLDDDNTPFNKPVERNKYSIMKQIGAYNSTEEISGRDDIVRQRRKVFMAPDYGRDNFNSGLMLYRPQLGMFADFRLFLEETILPMEDKHRLRLVRSTQRLLQEFLFMPTTMYDLYNFCPKSNPSRCALYGCDCDIHIYPQSLDCRRDQELLREATLAHFAGSVLDYETLCDPKSSSYDLNATVSRYFANAKGDNPKKSNFDYDCQLPMIWSIRNLYFDAIHRVIFSES